MLNLTDPYSTVLYQPAFYQINVKFAVFTYTELLLHSYLIILILLYTAAVPDPYPDPIVLKYYSKLIKCSVRGLDPDPDPSLTILSKIFECGPSEAP